MSRTTTDYDVKLGAAVRAQRKLHHLSQNELARRVGVTFQQIQKYESASNRIAVSTLVQIAEALDCSPASLMGMAETPFDLHDKDIEMLEVWRELGIENQATALRLFKALSGQRTNVTSTD